MKRRMTEEEQARILVDSLKEMNWTVYQEVEHWKGIADVVCVQNNIQWVIEVKTTFGLKVIEQAFRWKGFCNYVSICVPKITNSFGEKVCRDNGIGIIIVDKYGNCSEHTPPALQRRSVKIKLKEEQKDFCPAGNANGGRWTPFKQTCINLVEIVRDNEGIEFNQLIKELDHHYRTYSSAKSCLRKFIGTVIPELQVKIVGKKLCVFLAETK